LAAATRRRLLIRWTDPQGRDLTEYLVPADVDWDFTSFVARHPSCMSELGAILNDEGRGGSEQDSEEVKRVVSEADVRALLDGQDAVDGGKEDSLEAEGRREEVPMVVYSPDKLCPACPPLFNRSVNDLGVDTAERWTVGGRNLEGLGLVDAIRKGLRADSFFFLLGDVLRALFKLAPAMHIQYRERWWTFHEPDTRPSRTVGVQVTSAHRKT
jgi:hypothetical protein